MRLITMCMFFFLAIVVFAEDGKEACYVKSKADALLRIGNKSLVFETYSKWELDKNDPALLEKSFKWTFRDGAGKLLNDAELIEKVGQVETAEKLRESYQKDRRKGNVRLFVGTPLGLAMTVAGIFWMKTNSEATESSTFDKAGAVVISVTGVGVTVGSLLSFLGSRSKDPNDHDITRQQALDVLDRHNNAVATKCGMK